ncbi:MAG: molybdopterin-dependent oxidoreductase, partial [Lachnospiraceae bacterium]|nr:molybdopterin-dependent oxidoreductase [Lachnospiraceae bacterium]
DVTGSIMYTNTVSNGAFRGFGGPQSIFAVETLMNHLAEKAGMTPLEYRNKHFFRQGDTTSTGGKVHQHVPIPEMIEKTEELIDYSNRYEKYSKPQSGRYRRGIGMSIFFHGCGFTGSGEAGTPLKDENGNITGYLGGSSLKLVKDENDRVEILVSNTDMGQGLKTTFSKIASKTLGIPYENVTVKNPDTQRVPNSGPTVASRSIMITGKLVERASQKLKEKWVSGEPCSIDEKYIHPDFMVPWDNDTFQGDAYPAFSFGLNVAEVELDTLTGASYLVDAAGVFDVGHVIDQRIMEGQAEGGMLQAFGYGSMEKMEIKNGRILQSSFTDYMIPTSMDTVPFKIAFIDNPYSWGPFGAKGAGELTLDGGAAAYEAALEQAMGRKMSVIPATPERVLEAFDSTGALPGGGDK